MKRKTLIPILVIEALILAGLAVLTMLVPNLFSSVLAFPMEQIAAGLAALAGTGKVGNGLAVALIVGLSAIPLLIALFTYPRDEETRAERFALALLTPVLVFSFFVMINPALLGPNVPHTAEGYHRVLRPFLALTVWTVIILFIVLRLIRLFRAGSRPQLMKYLRIVLCVLSMYLVAQAVVSLVISIMTPAKNEPTAADTVVNIVSCRTLAVTTGLCALQHVAQLVLLPHMTDASATVDIPVVSITFVVVILLFSRLLVENKQLRDDNSMII